MARQVPVEQLVGAAVIAECLGAGNSTVVHDWRRRYTEFPEPVAKLKTAPDRPIKRLPNLTLV